MKLQIYLDQEEISIGAIFANYPPQNQLIFDLMTTPQPSNNAPIHKLQNLPNVHICKVWVGVKNKLLCNKFNQIHYGNDRVIIIYAATGKTSSWLTDWAASLLCVTNTLRICVPMSMTEVGPEFAGRPNITRKLQNCTKIYCDLTTHHLY